MRFSSFLLLVGAVVAGAWAVLFLPYYVDAFAMQDVAGSAALSWSAFDENRGKMKLADELRLNEIPDYLTPDSCMFYTEGKTKVVDCEWTVDVHIPVVDQTRRLYFHVVKKVGADGRLQP